MYKFEAVKVDGGYIVEGANELGWKLRLWDGVILAGNETRPQIFSEEEAKLIVEKKNAHEEKLHQEELARIAGESESHHDFD